MREHHRQALRGFGLHHLRQPGQLGVQQVPVHEQQSRARLVLRGCGDVALHREMGKKRLNLGRAHVDGVPQAMEADEAACPIQVDLFGADGEVAQSDLLTQRLKQSDRTSVGGDVIRV